MFSYVLEYCTFYVNVYDFFFFFESQPNNLSLVKNALV